MATAAEPLRPALMRDAAAARSVAVVVPILNEAQAAGALADRLERLAESAAEIAVVDGGSADDGPARLAARLPDPRVHHLTAPRGRSRQMNAGAAATRAPILLFLHADTELPDGALAAVARAVAGGAGFGCFPVEIDSPDPRLRLASRIISARSRLLCSATGDQALFVRRDLFEAAGGFPAIDLCEDLALVRRLCGRAPFCVLPAPARTSARRWERHGVARTIGLMWALRLAFHLGVPPDHLARFYAAAR